MRSRRLRVGVAAATAAAVLLTACSAGQVAHDRGRAPDAGTERRAFAPGGYDPGDLEKDVRALAGWGVATYQDESATRPMVDVTGPRSSYRLLRSQVEVLGAEAAAGVGTLGADLDAAFSKVAGTDVPLSAMLAAYLRSGSAMATELRQALVTIDLDHPTDAVFPTVALVGFIGDLGSGPAQGGATGSSSTPPASFRVARPELSGQVVPALQRTAPLAAPAADGPCTTTTGWVEKTLTALFDGLRISEIDTTTWSDVLKPLGTLLNGLIAVYDAIRRGAQYVVVNGVKLLLEPVRAVLAQIAVIAGVVQAALTSIHPLTSSWKGPGYPEFGVDGGQELRYETTLHVRSTSPLVWPTVLVDCARAAGVTLPNPSLAGSRVRWEPSAAEPDVIRQLPSDEVLAEEDGGGRATFRFATSTEPRDWKERGAARSVRTFVGAVVERKNKQIKDAADAAVQAALGRLLGFLPSFLRQRATDLVRQAIDPMLQQLVVRSEYRTSRVFGVTRHNRPEETPTPTPVPVSPSPPPPEPVWVHVERPGIPGAVEKGRILELVACDGLAGTWRGRLRTGGLYDDGFQVPWANLPVTPFRIGNGRIGTARSRAAGKVYVPLPGQFVPVSYDLVIAVTGRSMTVDGVPVQPPVSFRNIPIRPAPAGLCR